jgi:DUF4097 and DUF4098 domain-containing protein YvlB
VRVETFKTPGHVRLELRVPAGSVEIEAVAGLSETIVSLDAPGEETEALVRTAVDAREAGGVFEVTVRVPESRTFHLFQRTPKVNVTARCPAGADVTVDVVSADVATRGRVGKAHVNGVSGDVTLEQVAGDASIKTISGDARVAEVAGRATGQSVSGDLQAGHVSGATEMRTISGDTRLGRLDGPLTASSVSGDIAVDSVAKGEVTLKTVSGDIKVGIRPGSRLWVDARSIGGRTSSELPVSDESPHGNGPFVELRATATSGDIRVVRGD